MNTQQYKSIYLNNQQVRNPELKEPPEPRIMTTTLVQTKLTAEEWNSVEIPEKEDEIEILKLMKRGFHDVNIVYNNTKSLAALLKITPTEEMTDHLFSIYFKKDIDELCSSYDLPYKTQVKPKKEIKKIDQMRIQNMNAQIESDFTKTFDQLIISIVSKMLEVYNDEDETPAKWMYYYYSAKILLSYKIEHCNQHVIHFVEFAMRHIEPHINIRQFIKYAYQFVEKNAFTFKYADHTLYEHQKQLFTISKRANPKLILYIAPTGTGKTLSPLGLSEKYRVIFVCAARHVGLALAKAAINIQKKIAFAFGCNSSEDIRLHYFAAKETTRDKRSGRIRKVDNSVGDDVEIMICDIRSYLHAMNYMNAFNPLDKLITYWDEPTISLDYDTHDLHAIIHENWSKNIVPNVVLSSATLPREEEISLVLADFKNKFNGAEIHSIVSHDFKKSIPIVNQSGFVELPHFMFDKYPDVVACAEHCETYKTLMRYFDLRSIIRFIECVHKHEAYTSRRYNVDMYFEDLSQINMTTLKTYYLELLQSIDPDKWDAVIAELTKTRKPLYESTINITTSDAHTLTDGPTIYLAKDPEKIAKFALQIAKIPDVVMDDIMKTINYNNDLQTQITKMEKELTDMITTTSSGGQEIIVETKESVMLQNKIEETTKMVKHVSLHSLFIPNRLEHLKYWTKKTELTNEFTSNIDAKIVEDIMLLNVENRWKLLLLMGIGAFTENTPPKYLAIMKTLAAEQKLYLIITSTDYVYGTNFQFCHSYVAKDLLDMTQEKAIQTLGRVGRRNIQQDYTIRIRDDAILRKLFTHCNSENKPEVVAMNRLFTTSE